MNNALSTQWFSLSSLACTFSVLLLPVSVFITDFLSFFDWYHTAIIYDVYGILTRLQGLTLNTALRDDPRYPRPFVITFDARLTIDYDEMLLEASKYARGRCCSIIVENFMSSKVNPYFIRM